jgi:hypothetical protein
VRGPKPQAYHAYWSIYTDLPSRVAFREVPNKAARAHYTALWSAEVQTSTKRSLMDTHWPVLQARFAPHATEMVDLETRSGDIGPFCFKVQQTLAEPTEADAIAACLRLAVGMKVSLRPTLDSRLEALNGRLYGGHRGAIRVHALQLRQLS